MTQRYLGGIITANPVEPSENFADSAASGMWTMQEALAFSKAGDWPDPTSISPSKFVENVFSTYVYTGTGSSQTITNGIDLSNEGGLVWIKNRENVGGYAQDHSLIDTERGHTVALKSNSSSGNITQEYALGTNGSFNSNGFTQASTNNQVNASGTPYISWTFRKQPKFFDVVTYTGNGSGADRQISHSLGVAPGMILIKRTSGANSWYVFHRETTDTDSTNAKILLLNSASGFQDIGGFATKAKQTDAYFTVNAAAGSNRTNDNNETYVAYLFAHNDGDGGFGATGDQDIIKCGSYTGNGSTSNTITLGFEPQWIMIKNATSSADWIIFDTIRGIVTGGNEAGLIPNTNEVELSQDFLQVTSQGFELTVNNSYTNNSGKTYVYMAIRKGLMNPTVGTQVFAAHKETSATLNDNPKFVQTSGFPVDFVINKTFASGASWWSGIRKTNTRMQLESTQAESSVASTHEFDNMTGVGVAGLTGDTNFVGYMFRTADGFFDIATYTGNGTAGKTVNHNLGAIPQMMWVKSRSDADNWIVYTETSGNTKYQTIDSNIAAGTWSGAWNNTTPTSSVFTVGDGDAVNENTDKFVAFLFATVAGVSKVGTYSGTGSDVDVDCGFTSGARFVLAKRTDSTGDWYIWDSVNGIVSGNDPYIILNTTAAPTTNTDYIDPLSSGFTITSNAGSDLNHNGGSYVFLAIA